MHKPNCEWENYYNSLTYFNPVGRDEKLTIMESGIEYEGNIHASHPDDKTIVFNFCPLCGLHL